MASPAGCTSTDLELNETQRLVAEHGDGPILVVAGAGKGQTTTLAARVGVLLERGAATASILLLTFSRRGVAKMVARAGRPRCPHAARRVWGGRFHAVAVRILHQYGGALGLPAFSILDQSDTVDLISLARSDVLGATSPAKRFPKAGT